MMSDERQQAGNPEQQSAEWQRELIERLALQASKEQQRTRRWGIFFKSLLFVYLFVLLYLYLPSDLGTGLTEKHTALVELKGVISPNDEANADDVAAGLRDAFENEHSVAVILRINSPGGSPVQAGYINAEIRRLRKKYPDKPLYAVVSDICASGGYYVAVAADKIYADKASIVGSIGVRMDGFGFVEAIDKLGIERRLLTAGEHKGFLDPFLPEKESDVQHVKGLLNDIHQQFIAAVRDGRGERLKETPELFSGLVWTGDQAVELGLVDALGSAGYVAREVIGEETIVDYTKKEELWERVSKRLGTALGKGVGQVLVGASTQIR